MREIWGLKKTIETLKPQAKNLDSTCRTMVHNHSLASNPLERSIMPVSAKAHNSRDPERGEESVAMTSEGAPAVAQQK